ncbi:MAG: hypothetical protein EXR50_07010 [Dehalococcoidia bacterium]|nr:hypothetical protein [Dehalococcoidia bacterium]
MNGCPIRYSCEGGRLQIGQTAVIAENATIIGDVVLEAETSIRFGVVIRGDGGPVRTGEGTNHQDNTVLHDRIIIGKGCTVGLNAMVDGCEMGDNCPIGAGSIVTVNSRREILARAVRPREVQDGQSPFARESEGCPLRNRTSTPSACPVQEGGAGRRGRATSPPRV